MVVIIIINKYNIIINKTINHFTVSGHSSSKQEHKTVATEGAFKSMFTSAKNVPVVTLLGYDVQWTSV
jgi:hypothetical protein